MGTVCIGIFVRVHTLLCLVAFCACVKVPVGYRVVSRLCSSACTFLRHSFFFTQIIAHSLTLPLTAPYKMEIFFALSLTKRRTQCHSPVTCRRARDFL